MSAVYVCPPVEWACTPGQAWAFGNAGRLPQIPVTADRGCSEPHPVGWSCTRRWGHTGRHAATLNRGHVVAVWS